MSNYEEATPIHITISTDKAYLIPLGDIHLGAEQVNYDKLKGYIDWVKSNKYAYIFLMGDIFDVATRDSPTSPFEQKININEAMEEMTEIIKPVRKRVIGCIEGNHERRLKKYAGLDVLRVWCESNHIRYCGHSAAILFSVKNVDYTFFAHHSTGGGQTIGGKLNRIAKLMSVFADADCYLGGHNHSKALGEDAIAYLDKRDMKIRYRRILYVDCGSFLEYPSSYAEAAALPPSHTGAPRIRMSGIKKDLHVSF